jgi:hypothetical protein
MDTAQLLLTAGRKRGLEAIEETPHVAQTLTERLRWKAPPWVSRVARLLIAGRAFASGWPLSRSRRRLVRAPAAEARFAGFFP